MNTSAQFSGTPQASKDPSEAIWNDRSLLVWKIVAPIFLIFGITGNVLALLVLHRVRHRSAAYKFFMALAGSDLGTMLLGLFPRWIDKQFNFHTWRENFVICTACSWIGRTFGSLSAHLLIAVTVYRAIAACRPYHLKRVCSHRRVVVTIMLLVLLNILQYIYLPFTFTSDGTCQKTAYYQTHVHPIMIYFYLVQFSLGPFLVIFICNLLIIRTLVKSLPGPATAHKAATRRHRSTSNVVIAVCVAFLVLTFPSSFSRIVLYNKQRSGLTRAEAIFFKEVAVLIWYLNSGINFYLYICTSPDLRQVTKDYIFCRPRLEPSSSRWYSSSYRYPHSFLATGDRDRGTVSTTSNPLSSFTTSLASQRVRQMVVDVKAVGTAAMSDVAPDKAEAPSATGDERRSDADVLETAAAAAARASACVDGSLPAIRQGDHSKDNVLSGTASHSHSHSGTSV